MAELADAASPLGDPVLLDHARSAQTSFREALGMPIDHGNPALMETRLDVGFHGFAHLAAIRTLCRQHGFDLPFPTAKSSARRDMVKFRKSHDRLVRMLYDDDNQVLPLDDEAKQAVQFSVTGDIAAGIRELFNDCCRQPESCHLLATTANKCDHLVGRRFVMIDAVEYYIGGLVFTVLVDDPSHRILFIWWRDPYGIVYIDEPALTSAERDNLAAREEHLLEYARTNWPSDF